MGVAADWAPGQALTFPGPCTNLSWRAQATGHPATSSGLCSARRPAVLGTALACHQASCSPTATSPIPFCSACASAALPGAVSPAGALGGAQPPPRHPSYRSSLAAPSPCQSRVPPGASAQAVPGWPLGTPTPARPPCSPRHPPTSSTGPPRHAGAPTPTLSSSTVQALSRAVPPGGRGRGDGSLSQTAEPA